MAPKDQQAYRDKNKDKLSPCLGKKGAWAPDLVNFLTRGMETQMSPKCAQCVVKQLEDTYDPVAFGDMNEAKSDAAISNATNRCFYSKGGCP